jgi:dimethylargininase
MLRSEGERLRRAVVSAPRQEYSRPADPRTHNIPARPDPRLARDQHGALRAALERAGCRVVEVPELPGHPNSVFTRDPAVVTPRGYVRLRMGLPSRRGEEAWIAGALEEAGEPCAGAIEEPGMVEGGDVILAGEAAFLGLSGRTNGPGAEQLGALLAGMGFEVRRAAVPAPFLHLGGAMSVVGPGKVLCQEGIFPSALFQGFETIEVPAGGFAAANVIGLGGGEVLLDTANVAAARALERAGLRVVPLDLSEFAKGAGGPSCLVLPLERG